MNAVEQSAVQHPEESAARDQRYHLDDSGHCVVHIVVGPLYCQLILSHLPPVKEEEDDSEYHIGSDSDEEEDSRDDVIDVGLLVCGEHHGQDVAPDSQLERTHEGGDGGDEGSRAGEYFDD